MAVVASCRDSLKKFECACRDNTLNFDNLHPMLDQMFLINGEIPSELEYVELLDAFISHFALNCEEEIRDMVFHLLFPCTLNPNPLREEFLIRLTQLAMCVGVSTILDLVAVRLKAQIFLAIKSLQVPLERQLDVQLIPASRIITNFVRRVVESALTVRDFSNSCKHILQTLDFTDVMDSDKPLINILCLSPLLVSALVSGITLSYVAPLTRDDSQQSPPPLLLEVLLIWLKSARLQGLQSDWVCIDWESLFIKTPPRFLDNAQSPNLPSLIANAWPVARGLVWWTILTADRGRLVRPCAILDRLFSELHYEVLEQFATPLLRVGVGGGGRKFSDFTWRLSFPSDLLPIAERLRGLQDLRRRLGDSIEHDNLYIQLPVIRLTEVVQIAWSNDRILDCDANNLHSLLKLFNSHRIVQLVLHSLRR